MLIPSDAGMVSNPRDRRWFLVAALLLWAAATMHGVQSPGSPQAPRLDTNTVPDRAAWIVRDLTGEGERSARADILDTPVQPGSVMKLVTLAAALESGVVTASTTHMCRRVVTIDGHRYVCSHPDLKRPLTAVEALAHSCNDFFLALAPRLSRAALNDVRARSGLAPVAATSSFPAALIGLDGPPVAPRALLDSVTRLLGFDRARPVRLNSGVRNTLLAGMREAAAQGSASELSDVGIRALAKTGTGTMPGGGALGLMVAFEPADAPRRALVVVAPGAAGRDAVSIAADVLRTHARQARTAGMPVATPPDTLRVGSPTANGSTSIATLAVEDYVARVVAAEGAAGAPAAASQALAVAVRTFAQAHRARHASEGYDLCDTTHCQVLRPATTASRAAASATAGRILTFGDRPAAVYYSASCGGHTERPSRVWAGASDPPFLPAQADPACGAGVPWTSTIVAADIERALRAAGLRGTLLRSLRVVERSASGRVTRLQADGFTPATIDGESFRLALGRTAGWQWLKSTLFDIRREARGYTFIGRGFGHGVGMCVDGAGCRAAAGATAEEILAFYYPGTSLRAGTTTAIDIQLALPPQEERERQLITSLARSTAIAIAARAGVAPPPSLRITVHPSPDAFRRATRQPWWVGGTTRGSSIDLLPVSTLRMRGLLERTVRHEIAHVVVDQALTGAPLWVREGAAAYFAEPASTVQPVPGTCPADEEILDAASSEALGNAYARADACFRRQIAAGRRWTDVR
jgi:stage II sporulation protein D